MVSRIGLLSKIPSLASAGKQTVQRYAASRGTRAVAKVGTVGITGAAAYNVLDVRGDAQTSAEAINAARNASALGIPTFQQRRENNEFLGNVRPEYKIHFFSEFLGIDEAPIRVSAYLPENITLSNSSRYNAPFSESVFGSDLTGNVLRSFGNTGIIQEMTFKVWESSDALHFSIPVQFVADDEYENNRGSMKDIRVPILNLMKLNSPSKVPGSTFLKPPGPSLRYKKSTDRIGRELPNEQLSDQGRPITDTETIDSGLERQRSAFSFITNPGSIVDTIKDNLEFDKRTSVYIGDWLTLDNIIIENVSQVYDMVLGPDRRPLRASVTIDFSTAFTPTIQDLNAYFNYSEANLPPDAV